MLYNQKCPKCGAEQKGLDLVETDGTYICSNCGEEVKVDLEKLNEQTKKRRIIPPLLFV